MVKMLQNRNTEICDKCKCLFSYEDEDITKHYGARYEYYRLYSKRIKCPNCGDEKYLGTFEEFYNIYIAEVKRVVDDVTEKISLSQKERALYNPLPMRTLLIDDCIDNETEYNNGGARYKWSIINFAGMINVIDSMLVIKEFVFDERKIGAKAFCDKLRSNDSAFLSNLISQWLDLAPCGPGQNIFF